MGTEILRTLLGRYNICNIRSAVGRQGFSVHYTVV